MVTEKEKMVSGEMYDATDPQLTAERRRARDLCKALSESHDSEQELRERIIRELFGSAGDSIWIEPPLKPSSNWPAGRIWMDGASPNLRNRPGT